MKIIIGAGGKKQEGWRATEQSELDLLCPDDFERVLDGAVGFECILTEHCLEHLSYNQIPTALQNCYDYLALDGRLRIAVPDGFHPDPDYIAYVSPQGPSGHQILFNHLLLTRLLTQVGFRVEPLEWWDVDGKFHCRPWNEMDGNIERCLASDPRNTDGKPHYTSLIVDAFKDYDYLRPSLPFALEFVEKHDPNRVSPFNRKKTTTFYELARLAPPHGVIVELGSYHGNGSAALWYGARDGHRCELICVDAYSSMRGWANEPYTPEDQRIWETNMAETRIYPRLIKGEIKEVYENWSYAISLLVHDLGTKNRMPQDVLDWEKHMITGGIIAMRDIDDYSMGTEQAVKNLLATGRWGKRRNWEAFITSLEGIA